MRRLITLPLVALMPMMPVHHTAHVAHHVKAHVAHHVKPLVAPQVMKAWNRVYRCETHNWRDRGPFYMGGLGMTLWNWQHHGGLRFAPTPYLATPQQQVSVALQIQHGLPTPDQTGDCRDW